MSLSPEETLKIAKLARINLAPNEVEEYCKELSDILDWVAMLNEVDTSNVTEMTSVEAITLPFRSDHISAGNQRDEILLNAPDSDYGCFIVPKVVEEA